MLKNDSSDLNAIIESNNRIALQAFKNNLPEPTKSIILSRNPKDLTDAFKIIIEINHQRLGSNQFRISSHLNFFSGSRPSRQNSQYNGHNSQTQQNSNNLFSGTSHQNNNSNRSDHSRQNTTYNRSFTPRQNNNSRFSGQSHHTNNNSDQSRVINGNMNNGRWRNSNGNRQFNAQEPMDISLNEDIQNDRVNFRNHQDFSSAQTNNYPI